MSHLQETGQSGISLDYGVQVKEPVYFLERGPTTYICKEVWTLPRRDTRHDEFVKVGLDVGDSLSLLWRLIWK